MEDDADVGIRCEWLFESRMSTSFLLWQDWMESRGDYFHDLVEIPKDEAVIVPVRKGTREER